MGNTKKTIPQYDLFNIAPPYADYQYFENYKENPFKATAKKFELVNAWWLAEISTLVYSEEDVVKFHLRRAELYKKDRDLKLFSGTTAQCFVISAEDFVLIAFRGTEIRKRPGKLSYWNIVNDVLTDANLGLVKSGQGGYVHKGFKEALDEIWYDEEDKQGLASYVNTIKLKNNRKQPVWFTGHSLGGALATLAADRYGDVQGLYTFGSPKVGDKDFGQDFRINTYRFVNNRDIVTRLPTLAPYLELRIPPIGNYQHVGQLKYIEPNGNIDDNQVRNFDLENTFIGSFANLLSATGTIKNGFANIIPEDILDHVPTLYAIHIWNEYIT